MKSIIFKLPKILHNEDFFIQKLITNETETWYGFNKKIQVSDIKEYLKIQNNTMVTFALNEMSPLFIIPLTTLPTTNYIDPYYSLLINGCPLIVDKQKTVFFKLQFCIKNKKYIKFKENPAIRINIFKTSQEMA